MRLALLLIWLPFGLSCKDNQSAKGNSQHLGLDTIADTYTVTGGNASMNLAILRAKNSIDEFDEALTNNNPSCTDFAVKKRYETLDGGGEHMWIGGITKVEGAYVGFVSNIAEKTTEVNYGDTVIVEKSEITDWMYLENNVLRGGYTILEMRDQMSKEDRLRWDLELGFKIEE